MRDSSRNRRRGQAALLMTMSLTATVGAIGLVVDFGWSYWRKEAAATSASSAASAAIMAASSVANQSCGTGATYWNCSSSYSCPASPSAGSIASNLDNGCLYAKQNGFLNTGRQTVTMQTGTGTPPTAPGTTSSYYVIANVSENIPTLFSAILGRQWMQVKSQATASIVVGTPGGCVYVLDPSANGAWTSTGGEFDSACGIYIASSSSSALSDTYSGVAIAMSGGANIYVNGGASINYSGSVTFSGGGSIKTGQSVSNPVSGLTAPTCSSPTADPVYTAGSGTIASGCYSSLTIKAGTFVLSGTYYIQSGDFKLSGGTVTTAAAGAAFYFPGSGGQFKVTGGSITLNAPTSGSLQGFAIWKDGTTSNTATYTGCSGSTPCEIINGIIYMPSTNLTYTGGTTAVTQSIVVDKMTVTGGNLSHPATSTHFSNGGSPTGSYLVQ